MKVLHFGSLDYNVGGPAMSTYHTLKGLKTLGLDVMIAMYSLNNNGKLWGEDVPIYFCKKPLEQKFAFSNTLKQELSAISNVDIYHAQGIWQYPTYALVDIAKKNDRPYLITPRGMLYPQDIAKASTFFKKLSLKLRLLYDLNNSACVHVTCEEEMIHCRNLGISSPIAIIPNPVEIKNYLPHTNQNCFTIGYLGRISRRKNIESLIYSLANLGIANKECQLLIIGGGDHDYESFLKAEVKRLRLENVHFLGFLSGKEKDEALSKVDILVMPSEFENLGNAVLEGLVRGIPCIATKGSPWKDLETYNCGWWVEYNQLAITEAIRSAFNSSKSDLAAMGRNGRILVENNYSVNSIANKMKGLYEWIISNSQMPDFVFV